MNVAMLQNICDQAKDFADVSFLRSQLRDLKDDIELKNTLLKSSKELESRNAKEIVELKESVSKTESTLAEEKRKNSDLVDEVKKLKDEISRYNAKSIVDDSAQTALRVELQKT